MLSDLREGLAAGDLVMGDFEVICHYGGYERWTFGVYREQRRKPVVQPGALIALANGEYV